MCLTDLLLMINGHVAFNIFEEISSLVQRLLIKPAVCFRHRHVYRN
jgi:hypothetical protein